MAFRKGYWRQLLDAQVRSFKVGHSLREERWVRLLSADYCGYSVGVHIHAHSTAYRCPIALVVATALGKAALQVVASIASSS